MKTAIDPLVLNGQAVQWQQIAQVARDGAPLILSEEVQRRMQNARDIVKNIVRNRQRAYGISTGLGALSDVLLEPAQLSELSYNTLLSHACGVGDPLPEDQTRAIMCVAVVNYCKGTSGISPELVTLLAAFLNQGITPCIPKKGSIGYLTHMAHIGLALLGIGEVFFQGQRIAASDALSRCQLQPGEVGPKDGLSLVNGTPCVTGLACLALDDCYRLAQWADVTAAMSFEALKGQYPALDEDILGLKPYPGLMAVGRNLRSLLAQSDILQQCQGIRTQDALSIRAIPQVHGACRDQFDHVARQLDIELNASTDNPLVLGSPEDYRVVSNAHPHGESIAMACALLTISAHELASVAERRLDRLINPLVSGLPAFLVEKSGVNSGMMITQYVAASLVSENKLLCQPSVADNFVTSALQEDHLSLGTPAAIKLHEVISNSFNVIAIEYLSAAQAFEFYPGQKFGKGTSEAWHWLRDHIPAYQSDRWLAPDIRKCMEMIRSHRANDIVKTANIQLA